MTSYNPPRSIDLRVFVQQHTDKGDDDEEYNTDHLSTLSSPINELAANTVRLQHRRRILLQTKARRAGDIYRNSLRSVLFIAFCRLVHLQIYKNDCFGGANMFNCI